jgi:hypothetical protein
MALWDYRTSDLASRTRDVTGYDVHATDGDIGKIDNATYETGGSYIVVDTGFWIFGKKRMLPAGVVDRVDHTDGVVYVNRTKDQIKNAPDWDADRYTTDDVYRKSYGTYYEHL